MNSGIARMEATAALFGMRSLDLEQDGVCIVENWLSPQCLRELDDIFPDTSPNLRNGLTVPAVRELSRSTAIRSLVVSALGEQCIAVRAILFNKTADSNWKVSWHQDVVIAVNERAEVTGYGPWSVKDCVLHVRPPAEILERMLAVRVHLDDCGDDNGPLRVLPGSHNDGVLSDSAILKMNKASEFACSVKRGDAILMRPLLLHASSPARKSSSRRVIHIEFAAAQLPPPLQWHDVVA
jgi:ectoine hydroxylase-related dioxygenase (phytanoyl-CoA dioxygenase family)